MRQNYGRAPGKENEVMASVCGISIINRKSFMDHEDITCYQGDIYLDGKKIGFWSDDYMGSPWGSLEMELGYSETKLKEAVRRERGAEEGDVHDNMDISFELLMKELNYLENMENLYKEAKASGYIGILVSTDGFHMDYWQIPAGYHGRDIVKEYEEELEESHRQFFKNSKIEDKYYTENDFTIGNAISEKEIRI